MYGGLGAKEIHARKGLKKNQQILDHMGSTALAANLFRATQTDEKLRREQIEGKDKAGEVHFQVGQKVRQTIAELGGTMPEDLPAPLKGIKQIISKLNYRLGLNTEKIKLIEDNYKRPDPAGYVKAFSKRVKNLDNDMFRFMYDKYCAFKHVNFMSIGTMKENLTDDTIMQFIDTVAIIVMYLERYQLEPINDL